jgi:dimethylhistidine N-methyltransferase
MRSLEAMESSASSRVRFLVKATDDPLRHDGPNVIRDLSRSPKRISPVYVYDKTGTDLFERQCATEEYYLRRVEAGLLRSHAREIVERCGPAPLIELGAGTADKTGILFDEYARQGLRCDYFPIDVDTETLGEAAHRLASTHPHLVVHCLGTTYENGLRRLPTCAQRRLFLFLGSSLGNMELEEMEAFLANLFYNSATGDCLLIGADLDKDAAIINKAYNDAAGYGPRSTLNMLQHLNRRYDGDFVTDNFRYRSVYDRAARRNEVHIESLAVQTVTLAGLGFTVSFGKAERIEAEIMWKFDPDRLAALLERAGFAMTQRWIDPVLTYGLFLLRRK